MKGKVVLVVFGNPSSPKTLYEGRLHTPLVPSCTWLCWRQVLRAGEGQGVGVIWRVVWEPSRSWLLGGLWGTPANVIAWDMASPGKEVVSAVRPVGGRCMD
jgi:hypothetical protein